MADARKTRVLSDNDMYVIMSDFLSAAREIHIAMCQFSDDHAAQANLNAALHHALGGAEMCRQLHASPKRRLEEPS